MTERRRHVFTDEPTVELLRAALRQVQSEWPFEIVAAVILPDHTHFMWALPDGDDAYSKRLGRMKVSFTQSLPESFPGRRSGTASRRLKRESDIWQRRFWEHTIRDDDDFKAHLDYIHYNPVRHGYVTRPADWEWSSFGLWFRKGEYEAGWGAADVRKEQMDSIASRSGE